MKKLTESITLSILFLAIAIYTNAQGTCTVPNSPLINSKATNLEGGNYYQDIILKDGATVSVTDPLINLGIDRKVFVGKG